MKQTVSYGKHQFCSYNDGNQVDGVEGLLEVDKSDSQGELVFLKAFHNSSQDVYLLCAAASWSKTSLVTSQLRVYMWPISV